MSYILIDAGNSFLKIALIDSSDDSNITYINLNYTNLYDDLLEQFNDAVPSQVIVCNVSNPVNFNIISDVIYNIWRIHPYLVQVQQDKYGISTRYTNPRVLGCDRWVAMIAARHEFDKTLCVIDCGTAVTVDVVTESGMHVGGLITPGINTARNSLGLKANNLPSVDNNNENINNESSILAINTQDAILGGTLYQLSAYIERIVSEIKHEFGEDIECVITGGDADKIQALTYHNFHHRKTLVLDGLKILAEDIFEKDIK
ncbi:MAG: type III pantothenate kinase [Gammaproteobacteria bacterium]|nr:type III pantothenate kinase [Gammaproteobacteria bacterium]